jgi:hypothetical protein
MSGSASRRDDRDAPPQAVTALGNKPVTITVVKSALAATPAREPATLCERCAAEMYRMQAVWRCPACGFKTDCCGW